MVMTCIICGSSCGDYSYYRQEPMWQWLMLCIVARVVMDYIISRSLCGGGLYYMQQLVVEMGSVTCRSSCSEGLYYMTELV